MSKHESLCTARDLPVLEGLVKLVQSDRALGDRLNVDPLRRENVHPRLQKIKKIKHFYCNGEDANKSEQKINMFQ